MDVKYSAAVDLSGKYAAFALAKSSDGNLQMIVSKHKKMQGRSSAALSSWMLELLAEADVAPAAISEWTVGSGPGSFTGMRLAAALVTGISLGKANVKTRCVPGAIALANSLDCAENEKAATLFDGRNREILLFELIKRNGEMVPTGLTKVLDHQQAAEFFANNVYKHLSAPASDAAGIKHVLETDVYDKVQWVEHLPLEKLIYCKYQEFDNDLTRLVYIRPAVFS